VKNRTAVSAWATAAGASSEHGEALSVIKDNKAFQCIMCQSWLFGPSNKEDCYEAKNGPCPEDAYDTCRDSNSRQKNLIAAIRRRHVKEVEVWNRTTLHYDRDSHGGDPIPAFLGNAIARQLVATILGSLKKATNVGYDVVCNNRLRTVERYI